MRKLYFTIVSIVSIVTFSAFAGDHTIDILGRMGWMHLNHDSATTPNSSSFNIDNLKTTFAGVISPTVKYTVALNLLGTTVNDVTDGTTVLVDEAFLSKTFATGTVVSFGKKGVMSGGRENDYGTYDRYTSSYFVNDLPVNQVGLTIAQDFLGQSFVVQYFNGNKNNGQATTVNAQSKYGWAVGWNGNLFGGLVKPIAAYTVVPEGISANTTLGTSNRVSKGDDVFLAGGVQFTILSKFILEVDYDLLTEKDATGSISAKKDLKTESMVALLKYNTELCSPFVKLISDTSKLDSTKTGTRTAYDLGVEFKYSKEDTYRYHLVYSGSAVKTNMDTTTVKNSPSMIMVGVKFDASLLK